MWETWTPAVDADDQRGGDLAIGVAAGKEGQDIRLARGQAEDLLQGPFPGWRPVVGRGEVEPGALGEQLELGGQGAGADPGRDGVRVPQRHARLGAGRARGDQRLGLAPAAVGGQRRAFEPVPGHGRVRPRLRPGGAAGAVVLGPGEQVPAGRVRRDRRGIGGGAASGGEQLAGAVEPAAERVVVPAGAGERGQFRLGA